MDKYVIDLDKVLDELELNDKFEESNDVRIGHCLQPTFQNSLVNINDIIDDIDADFSIHSKPPKLLTSNISSKPITSGTVFIEHNNNVEPISFLNNDKNAGIVLETVSLNLNEANLIDCDTNEINNSESLSTQKEDLISTPILNDKNHKPIVMDKPVINESFNDNINNQEIKNELFNTAEIINSEQSVPKAIEEHNENEILDNINISNTDNETTIDENNEKISNNLLESTNFSNISEDLNDTSNNKTLLVKENADFKNENKLENSEIMTEQPQEELNNESKLQSTLSTDEKIDDKNVEILNEDTKLNEDAIEKMTEEDLDKYLVDLNVTLDENNVADVNNEQPSLSNDNVESSIENKSEENISSNENNSNQSIDSMIVTVDDVIDDNLISCCSQLISENDTNSQLQELEELLASTSMNDNNSRTNMDTRGPEYRGGLVQNINYFEREEMPNGLTEEEIMLGKRKPFWIPDDQAQNCLHCDIKFTLIKRRHHCRSCGKVLCSQCCNYKAKLPYLENKEARVCQLCYGILIRIEEMERINAHQIVSNQIALNNQMDNAIPDPNNPAEYCSTISPLEQTSETVQLPPLTVMVPVGVLKRPGSSNNRRSNNSPESSSAETGTVKQVMFSDGVRPGGDLVEHPSSSRLPEEKPITRTQLQVRASPITEKILVPFENFSKRIKMSRVVIPDQNGLNLPPIINYNELKTVDSTLPSKPNYAQLIEYLRNPQMPCVTFGLTKNLHITTKIVSKTCCGNKECWTFSSKGLASVGQDEILFVLDCDSLKRSSIVADGQQNKIPEDTLEFPRDIFRLCTTIYDSASAANLYLDLTHIFFPDGLFNNKENSGFIFTTPTLQCFQNINVPSPPFLIAILIHKWEIPWAKVFPLRLVLRLGYEYKMYPTPVISYANRKSVYFEIGHTIMNVLADFRSFHYTLSVVKDLFICVTEKKKVNLLIPKLSYEKVCKVLSTSNEHVLAFGGNFSSKCDSHFVCVQNEDDDTHNQYQTELSSFPSSENKCTGASFIVFCGALKSTTGLKAKMNIVEDGLLVQIPPTLMEELRSAIKNMKDFKIDCCKVTENSSEEFIQLKWVNDELTTNLRVRSQIDGLNLEGVQSARIFSNPDYANERYLIRWIEVFLLQINDNSRRSEMINANKLAESVAQAFCVALIDYLDQLYENGLTKISLRISLDVDKVGYETGSGGKTLPAQITQPLDSALIPVIMENISTTGIEDPLVIELLFFVLLK